MDLVYSNFLKIKNMIRIKSISGFSKQGKRENNEDYVLFKEKHDPDSRFIILCDGMGGHGHGEVASQTVANAVFEYLKSLAKENYEAQDLQDALNTALSTLTAVDVYDDKKSMGTTLVVVVVNKMNVLVGHVGDSRCYLFDEDGIKKFRTKDHSKVAEAIEAEILTEEEAFENSHKNLLTRCVMSGKSNIQIDVDFLQIENNDRLLLCSDGVNDAMRDKEIEEYMINRDIKGVMEIIDDICSEKSNDNYSVVIADFLQDEKNPIINTSNNHEVNSDIENDYYIDCHSCGERNDRNAKFCRKCGAELRIMEKDDINITDGMDRGKDSFLQRIMKKTFPLLCFVLGCLFTTAYYTIINFQKEKEQISIISTAQAKDMYFRQQFEKASLSFISNLCVVDTTKGKMDSVIYKDTLKKKYIDFCQQYKENENR